MSDLGWRANGIERAEAAGGVTLELYRKPGFVRAQGVRRLRGGLAGGCGIDVWSDPEPDEFDDRARRRT